MSLEQKQAIAGKLKIPVKDLDKYNEQIVPIDARIMRTSNGSIRNTGTMRAANCRRKQKHGLQGINQAKSREIREIIRQNLLKNL